MYLTNRFSSAFEKRIRNRGQSYFEARSVKIVKGSKEVVRAVVRGSYEYDVSLKIMGLELLAACTCAYYDHDLCKHIWATMLAAERKGYLVGTGHLPSRLVMSDEDFERPSGKPAPKPPVWRQQLESVNRSMPAVSDERTRPWPPSREPVYMFGVSITL